MFAHDLLLYRSDDDLVDATVRHVHDGFARDARAIVCLPEPVADAVRAEIGDAGDEVVYPDHDAAYASAAGLIDNFHLFVRECAAAGRPGRAVAEAPWARRGGDGTEWARLEAWLHHGFQAAPVEYLCAYDAERSSPEALEMAARTHPTLCGGAVNHDYAPARNGSLGWAMEDPGVPADAPRATFREAGAARRFVTATLGRVTRPGNGGNDLALAVHEIAANAIRHGGGEAQLCFWAADGGVVFEVRDEGGPPIDPMAGYLRPDRPDEGGWGLWLARQAAERVEIFSRDGVNVVRLRFATAR